MTAPRTAVVTGASRGIGAAVARRLAEDGVTVFGTATRPESAEAIAEALSAHGGRGLVLDQSDPDSVAALVASTGPVDILVNNAGVTADGLLLRMKDEQWDAVMETNLGGVFRLCRAYTRGMMKARWGRIVNLGSVVASMGNPGQANYCAAKAGLEGLTRSLAQELGSRGITVNVVAPGFIDTDMTRELGEEVRDQLSARIPAGRLGTPQDIAEAVSYLASDRAGYVTGTVLHVNGGLYMS